ncbi:retrovirus-related pol polyprotein from transposon TNT 1-94 [Tanacetum coccineum]
MPFSTYTNLGLGILSHTRLTIKLADRTIKQPRGIAKNVLVRIGKFIFLIDFIILDIPEDDDVPLILGRPFLSTAHSKIDVFKKKITLRELYGGLAETMIRIGVVIGGEFPKEPTAKALDHSQKLKGIENLSEAALYESNMKKAVPDEPKDIYGSSSSSCSASDDETKDISSDKEVKADENKAEEEKATEEQVDEEQPVDEQARMEQAGNGQPMDNQARNEEVGSTQAKDHAPEPASPDTSSSLILSSAGYGNQFLNENPDVSISNILKDTTEKEIQLMVDVSIHQAITIVQRTPLVDTVISMTTPTTTPPL